ncbi:MAG: transposase [Candidatus Eisenbacteria bacterium]|nr:transposase [Candidatus Eisenbacteria bacterium]
MPRPLRTVIPGVPHHVTQRGNQGRDIFETDDDRRFYLELLHRYAVRHGLAIWSYCLMTNHVHLVVVPCDIRSIALSIHDAHRLYAFRKNSRAGVTGHVWQARYYSCGLDERHLWSAVRYVERNPVRAGIVARAEMYCWSSAPTHCGLSPETFCSPEFPPPGVIENWAEWLAYPDDDQSIATIRRETLSGRPLGSKEFLERIESIPGSRVKTGDDGKKTGAPPRGTPNTRPE